MGFVRKVTGVNVSASDLINPVNSIGSKILGGVIPSIGELSGADAAREAAEIQTAFGREALGMLRGDLSPYREAGASALPQLLDMLKPENQANFLQNNPLLSTLANDTQARLFANQAARGKLGSGGTAVDLQNALIPLGLQAQQQQYNQLYNVANLGQASAAQTGVSGAGILQGIGNAQAAGTVGAANANRNLVGQIIGGGLGFLFGGGGM